MFRNIPTITKNLLLINIIVFLAVIVFQSQIDLKSWGTLHFFMAPDFHIYQLLTYQFLHADVWHIFFNMFALWMFGCVIERVWGPQRFLVYYLVCGIGAGLCQELVQYIEYSQSGLAELGVSALIPVRTDSGIIEMTVGSYLNSWGTIGASGAVYGILLAFGMTFPNERIFIFPLPVPIKAKWFVGIYAAIELFMAYGASGDSVAHVAHLGGMLFGLLLILYWRHRPGSKFNMGSGRQYFENMKRNFESRRQTKNQNQTDTRQAGFGPTREDDMEYNARKQQRQAEVDAILDKIRKSGYDSLSKEEKQRLFEASRER
ncbi:MAG: rhomboid family intramembrane serine protease [Prevotella sp.]|jgi:membrane associated rhomboid family serine protease|nr:rhomboid family intramembrane serine protease [Prevotella sp.]